MSRARKILLADPDAETVRSLARALRERGYQVSIAGDGSRALEMAVLRHPDLVLIDEACQLISARTFTQILRTNPRTEETPVIVTGASPDPERARGLRDGILKKPYNLDDVLGRVAHILHKLDAAREIKNETQEIEGSLKQMGVADLLQILGANRRSGALALEQGEVRGEINLVDGRPVNAHAGAVGGEKALFRLLRLREGSFAFTPGAYAGAARVQRGMEEALLEGMRQADEMAALLTVLPPLSARLQIAPEASLSRDLHPVTAEVVRWLAEPRALSEVLDLASATDFEVVAAVHALFQKGIARQAPPAEAQADGPLLGPAELHALRARVLRGRPAAKEAAGKVLLIADSQRRVKAFLERLSETPGYRLQRAPTPELIGTWARLELPDGLRLELFSIPGAEEARPLWRPFATGALGGIVLEGGPASARLSEFLARKARVPLLATVEGELPAPLKGLAAAKGSSSEPRHAIRALVEAVLREAA
jgi:CheY-like chemotaxis protein